MLDIEPISDKLMHITMNATLPITIINTHIPQAERPEEEKHQIYKEIRHILCKCRSKGPTYLIGDMNARIQKAEGRSERECIGPNTFEPESARVGNQSENVQQNRDLLIELCQEPTPRRASCILRLHYCCFGSPICVGFEFNIDASHIFICRYIYFYIYNICVDAN